MRISKNDVPVKIDAPGAVARQLKDFGDATGYGKTGGDLFYWPPGHTVRADADAEIILFSPQHEHGQVIDHILAKMQG